MNDAIKAVIDEVKSDNFMPKIVGQKAAKAQLGQRLLSFYRTKGFMPPILLESPRGYGKTAFVRGMGKRLVSQETGEPKPFLEINGSTLKSVGALIDVIGQYLAGPDGTSYLQPVVLIDFWLLAKRPRRTPPGHQLHRFLVTWPGHDDPAAKRICDHHLQPDPEQDDR